MYLSGVIPLLALSALNLTLTLVLALAGLSSLRFCLRLTTRLALTHLEDELATPVVCTALLLSGNPSSRSARLAACTLEAKLAMVCGRDGPTPSCCEEGDERFVHTPPTSASWPFGGPSSRDVLA